MDGYQLAAKAKRANWGGDVNFASAPARPRHLGGSGGNRLVGGLFLHATRRAGGGAACTPGSREAALAFECQAAAREVPLGRNGSSTVTSLAQYRAWLKVRDSPLAPYGIDPAFLRPSGLYRAELAGREGLYYNTSDTREVRGLRLSGSVHAAGWTRACY